MPRRSWGQRDTLHHTSVAIKVKVRENKCVFIFLFIHSLSLKEDAVYRRLRITSRLTLANIFFIHSFSVHWFFLQVTGLFFKVLLTHLLLICFLISLEGSSQFWKTNHQHLAPLFCAFFPPDTWQIYTTLPLFPLRSLTNCMVSSSKPVHMSNRRKAARFSDTPGDPAGRTEPKISVKALFFMLLF